MDTLWFGAIFTAVAQLTQNLGHGYPIIFFPLPAHKFLHKAKQLENNISDQHKTKEIIT